MVDILIYLVWQRDRWCGVKYSLQHVFSISARQPGMTCIAYRHFVLFGLFDCLDNLKQE